MERPGSGMPVSEDALMSPQRIDYYDSPEAPKPNSLVPAVKIVD